MSGAMRRIGEYLGLVEDTGRYDDDYAEAYGDQYAKPQYAQPQYAPDQHAGRYAGDDTGPVAVARPSRREQREARKATVVDLQERQADRAPRRPAPPVGVGAVGVAELSRITTLHPRTYNEARTVGENFRDGVPVIMNLTEMDDSDAKRLVDFAAGLVFATHGSIERITQKVFLLSPPNVTVAAEEKARLVEGGFFNQS